MKKRSKITAALLILLFFAAMGGLIAKRAELCAPRVPAAALHSASPAQSPPAKKTSKLRALYDRYRHVERVELRDGTVLFGVMHESEGSADLLTPDGKLRIPREEIVRVEYMNPDRI